MFVLPALRRRHRWCLLAFLEREAVRRGRACLVRETGDNDRAAIALYHGAGRRRIPPLGPYAGNAYSVCFVKRLP